MVNERWMLLRAEPPRRRGDVVVVVRRVVVVVVGGLVVVVERLVRVVVVVVGLVVLELGSGAGGSTVWAVVGATVLLDAVGVGAVVVPQPPQGTSVLPSRFRSTAHPLMWAAMSAAQNDVARRRTRR